MDLHLVKYGANKELWYYTKGPSKIDANDFSLLGFKENLAVVTPYFGAPKPKNQIKVLRKLLPSVSLSKLETDESGEKYINLNGQKLKVVPQARIPEEVRKRTMILKQQMSGNLKRPLQLRVISSTAPLFSDKFQFSKVSSADKLITINKDNLLSTIHDMKKKLITKLQNPDCSNPVIHTETSGPPICVNPPSALVKVNCRVNTSKEQIGTESESDTNSQSVWTKGGAKLLCKKTLKILNQVKIMYALNLSMKKKEEEFAKQERRKVTLNEIAVQTDDIGTNKEFLNQMVQTDFQQSFNFPEFLDSINILDMTDSSPILSDVNLGTGPTMGKIIKMENINYLSQTNVSVGDTIINPNVKVGQGSGNGLLEKRLLFFKDLRECLTYNSSGNLPIHEGILSNNVIMVKRHCIALKARRAGVNLENHNGCTPLQLAVVHDSDNEIVQALLDAEADITDCDGDGNNILHLTARFKRHKILEAILFHEMFSYNLESINKFNFEGLTPLMICCIANWTDGAYLFINHGANVNLRDQTSGRTALFHACESQSVEIVRTLLNNQADPKIKNFFGTSPHDAMYELDDMSETIKGLIFGRTKKRTVEAEMNPVRTAKAAKTLKTFSKVRKIEGKDDIKEIVELVPRRRLPKNLKTFSKLQKIQQKDGVPLGLVPIKQKIQRQIK